MNPNTGDNSSLPVQIAVLINEVKNQREALASASARIEDFRSASENEIKGIMRDLGTLREEVLRSSPSHQIATLKSEIQDLKDQAEKDRVEIKWLKGKANQVIGWAAAVAGAGVAAAEGLRSLLGG